MKNVYGTFQQMIAEDHLPPLCWITKCLPGPLNVASPGQIFSYRPVFRMWIWWNGADAPKGLIFLCGEPPGLTTLLLNIYLHALLLISYP